MPLRKLLLPVLCAYLPTAACGDGEAGRQPKSTDSSTAPGPTGTATISGRITFEGQVPPPATLDVASDDDCLEAHPDGYQSWPVRVTDGGLADVFVYVKSGISGRYPVPEEPAVLDQAGCRYLPYVLALQLGQVLRIRNLDDTLHNVHSLSKANPAFNIGQPKRGMESTRVFEKVENLIPMRCDVHPWMNAFISVVPHPFFAVSTELGRFEIEGLPSGEYEVEALHPKLPGQVAKVSVKGGESVCLDFTLER